MRRTIASRDWRTSEAPRRERHMLRTTFAIAVAGLIFVATSATTQAAPVAPLPTGIMADFNLLTDASWRRCWRDRWGRTHCRRCWRDRWGRVHCGRSL